ncbi:MAG: protein-L-isoaspartate(D-aspartate) O-methyltransferase [Methanomassiliicoccales archaeon]|nr:protein-L-isoaspartate(D-aspartate) O-methyltransferase [Methanomassiliicoccales archaeon]
MSFDEQRSRMVKRLLEHGYVSRPEVSLAMETVPRHLFVPQELQANSYQDSPLYIGEGQTISAPHMVGMMVENLDLRRGLKVLEIGGGSGYHAAVMAEMIRPDGHIYSVERIETLAAKARRNLQDAGYSELVTVIIADGSKGLPEFAPYDRISVAAAAPSVPEPLKEQLAEGGKLLVPVGGRWYQDLILVVRKGNEFIQENLGGCVFVPLVGEYGYRE